MHGKIEKTHNVGQSLIESALGRISQRHITRLSSFDSEGSERWVLRLFTIDHKRSHETTSFHVVLLHFGLVFMLLYNRGVEETWNPQNSPETKLQSK